MIAGSARPKSPWIKNSALVSSRASSRKDITSDIKELLMESQRELLKMLKSKTKLGENEASEQVPERKPRSFYTPTRSVKMNSTQNKNPDPSRHHSNLTMSCHNQSL